MPILKKKGYGGVKIREGSITRVSDLDDYPRDESFWKYVEPEAKKRGPVGAILSIFHCLKKINSGDWVTASSLIFGEHNFFTARRDLIEESERLQSSGIENIDQGYLIIIIDQKSHREINRRLIPELIVSLMEEKPRKVRGRVPEDQDDYDVPYVFQRQDIPNLDYSWPFYYRDQLLLISKNPSDVKWRSNLATIPQMIINLTFAEWMGSNILPLEKWGGGNAIVPLLRPFEALRVSGSINRKKWQDFYDAAHRQTREMLASTMDVDALRKILFETPVFYLGGNPIITNRGPYAEQREKKLGLDKEIVKVEFFEIDTYLEKVTDRDLLAEYLIQTMRSEAKRIRYIHGSDAKEFKYMASLFRDFGYFVVLEKMAFPDDESFLDPDPILAGYRRFDGELRGLLKASELLPPKLKDIKSTYPEKKEKRKIKFYSPQ